MKRSGGFSRGGGLALAVVALLLMGVGIGCRRDDISVVQTAKEPPRQPAPAAPAGHGMETANLPELKWEKPAGWEELPPSGMSLVRFRAPVASGAGADVSVLALPGVAARDVDVLNIFRERFSLPPLDEAAVAALGQAVSVGPGQGRIYDMAAGAAGATNAVPRMVVASLPHGGSSWYFRLMGAESSVEDHKPAFLSFLKSVRFEEAPGMGSAPAPARRTEGRAATPGAGGALPTWSVPAGWQEAPPTSMVLARFLAGGGESRVEITVTAFPGDVGGLVANVNRWRGQIGLPPLGEVEARQEAKPLEMAGRQVMLVDMSGQKDGRPQRLIGLFEPHGGRTWFYKLVGDPTVAAEQKEVLIQFVRALKYPDA